MNIAKTIQLDLAARGAAVQIGESAVSGDSRSRLLVFELMQEGKPWIVPKDVRASLAFRTEGGCSGEYDTMPDSSRAYSIEENRITVQLLDQIMAQPGQVRLLLVLRDSSLRQLSGFPVLMTVTEGIAPEEQLPREYYQVRDLTEINLELIRMDGLLKQLNDAGILEAAREAKEAAREAREVANSVNAEKLNQAIAGRGNDVYIADRRVYLLSDDRIIGSGAALPEFGGGMAFDSGYVDRENLLHLTMDGADIPGFEPFLLPSGGGGGSGSLMKLTTTLNTQVFSVLDRGETCVIPYFWSSVLDGAPTGSGFAEWSVGGSRVAVTAVEQGDQTFDVRPYLASGAENVVVLKVTDAYGTFRTMNFTISVVSFGLNWNLGETAVYEGALNLRLTPTGTGEKILRVSVDGSIISETTVVTTGRTTSVTVPVQSHGVHTIRAWVETVVGGETLATEPLTHLGVWLSEGVVTPVVGILTPELSITRYATAAVRWFVVDPTKETARVELVVDGNVVSVLEHVDRAIQTWSYKATQVGSRSLSVRCGHSAGHLSVQVRDLGYEIHPVTDGLELDLDPAGHSNSENGRENFGYKDGAGINHPLVFSENFDWTGGGFQTDEDGVTAFVVKRGCRVTLDRSVFDRECRNTGKNLKLIFKAQNVRNYDAELMRCKAGNIGIVVQAQSATVSSQLESMQVLYCEGRKIEMSVNIEAEDENAMAWIDLKGIQSCPPVRYGHTDSWAQSNSVPLSIGSDDADVWIYRVKLWGNSLGLYERLDDYIACAATAEEMAGRYGRNAIYNMDGSISIPALVKANPKLRIIQIRAARMTSGKEDEVRCDVELHYDAGGEKHHLRAQNAVMKAQGTSSLEYILAALNLDLDLGADGCAVVNGLGEAVAAYAMTEHSVPVNYFNLKANVASSESCNNVCIADEFNTYTPFLTAARREDPRVRDSVEGHPCAVFFTSTADAAIEVGARTVQPGETILYFVGDMNNSKKNFAAFGQDNSRWPQMCSVEIMNNTEKPCRFREEIAADAPWEGGDFEFRFPKKPTEEMKAAFRNMQKWVVSTDRDGATGVAFAAPVIYGGEAFSGDTAAYRKAKFLAEFEDYFVKDSALFFYLMGERHCLTDNRAKNVFPCYVWVPEKNGYRWAFSNPYDKDTAEGTDNSGGMTFSYGLEDVDMVGDSWVYNAHDSVLWCNIRDWMAQDLKDYYIAQRGSGAWSAERFLKKCLEHQDAVPEALRAEDMHNKYFLPWINKDAAAYAQKCHGTKEYQREQFERYQEVYMDTKYCDVSDRSDAVSMRVTVEKAEKGNLMLTAFSDMYLVVMYGNGGRVSMRVKRNVPTLIECPTDSLGDTETYIFAASNLTAISSLADMKPKFVLATTAKRLQELIVGSGEPGYRNLNLNQIGVGGNQMLRLLDLRGCPNLVTSLDLGSLTSLETFYAGGSGITGVSFAKGCPLRVARVPAVSSLVALDLKELESFTMDGSAMKLLRVENCPGIDTLSICKSARELERGRITGVDWIDDDAGVLMRLRTLAGYDAQGKPTEHFVLEGRCHVATITQLQIDAISAAFPELDLSYDAIVDSVTVTFRNYDKTVLNTQVVPRGGAAVNPITAGYIQTPQRPSDVENHYTYSGWDRPLTDIQADTVITARYSVSDRYYTVRYWYDAEENRLAQEFWVLAHSSCVFSGSEPEPVDTIWAGWDAMSEDVVEDMNIHAVYVTPKVPDSVPETYDYLYSDDPNDRSAFTKEGFTGILQAGLERNYFKLGDRIKLLCHTELFADTAIIMELRSYKHFMSAERDGKFAGPYFGMIGLMSRTMRMSVENTNAGGFKAADLSKYLNDTVYPGLPQFFKALIEKIQVLCSAGKSSAEIVSMDSWLTIESHAELGFNNADVPYKNEVSPGADEVTFACYTDNGSRAKKTYNGEGSSSYYWTRSPMAISSKNFSIITNSGVQTEGTPTVAWGVSFGFCVHSGAAG